MKVKSFIVCFGSFILVTALLYVVGDLFTIHWLTFHYEYTNGAKGFSIFAGSLTPIMIGLVVSFFAEKIYIFKHRQKLG
jgi:hypothetical protein